MRIQMKAAFQKGRRIFQVSFDSFRFLPISEDIVGIFSYHFYWHLSPITITTTGKISFFISLIDTRDNLKCPGAEQSVKMYWEAVMQTPLSRLHCVPGIYFTIPISYFIM
jgi:hypothetical protein